MVKAGIIGATGYTGSELIRLLHYHPKVELFRVASRSEAGNAVDSVHYFLKRNVDLNFCSSEVEEFIGCDVVFLALPHGESSRYAKALYEQGSKVIDLGADFRLNDYTEYAKWYAAPHFWPEQIEKTVYGLPEIHYDGIREAHIVANPGCFPTSIILGMAPLLSAGYVDESFIVADSNSGVTGAGKGLGEASHFSNINENIVAYKIGKHRHLAEIKQELQFVANGSLPGIVFNPHLAPIDRGILTTLTFKLKGNMTQTLLTQRYEDFYQTAPFVRVRSDIIANIKGVRGSNYCDISPILIDENTVVVVSAIDNLVKGASGQAVQNMNIIFGFDETEGLMATPLFP